MALIFPEGLVIKLWLNGQEVFNSKVEPGIDSNPFRQKWNAADNIKMTIFDTDAELKDYQLRIVDSVTLVQAGDNIVAVKTQLEDGTWKYHFEFSMVSRGVANQIVRIFLINPVNSMAVNVSDQPDTADAELTNDTFPPAMFEIDVDVSDGVDTVSASIYGGVITSLIITGSVSSTWSALFTNEEPANSNLGPIGAGVTQGNLRKYGNIEVMVTRTAGAGADDHVRWKKNGVVIYEQDMGEAVPIASYTFLDGTYTSGDTLEVDIS